MGLAGVGSTAIGSLASLRIACRPAPHPLPDLRLTSPSMHTPRLRRLSAAVLAFLFAAGCADAPTAPAPAEPAAPDAPSQLWWWGGPRLLECPISTTTSTTGVIGPLGGLLSLGDNLVSMPDGAVSTPTLFALTVPASRYMKVDVTAVGLDHYLFDRPISITVDYSRCPTWKTEGKALEVWYVSPLLNIPLENMGGVDDPANRRITFTTDHLSGYVIAY
jgi:hypothetical protein